MAKTKHFTNGPILCKTGQCVKGFTIAELCSAHIKWLPMKHRALPQSSHFGITAMCYGGASNLSVELYTAIGAGRIAAGAGRGCNVGWEGCESPILGLSTEK